MVEELTDEMIKQKQTEALLAAMNNPLVRARLSPAGFASYASEGMWHLAPHLSILNRKLMDVSAGRLKRLMIFMPPRSGKSELISKYFPVYYLGTHPDHRVIMAGHTNDFAMQWGRKARDIMEAYGKEVFGVEVSQTSSAADRWDIQGHVGGMDTAGVGGSLTGKGADLLVADDIVKGRDVASSSVKLENIFEWFTTDAYTRLMPGGRVVIVLTRWSMADPAGRLLSLMEDRERELADKGLKLPADERWEVLKFPAIAEEDEYYTEYNGEKKLFRKEGDVLWPQMFTKADMEDRRRTLGAYWFAAMYQQRPVPREGAVFNKDWFRYFTFSPDGQTAILYQPDMPTPKAVPINKCRRLLFVDTAGKTKSTNDYTAALATLYTPDKEILIFDGMNERLELPDQIKHLTDMYYKCHPSTIFVEDVSYGTALIQTVKRTGTLPIRPLEAEWTRRNKEDKAAAIVSRYQTGMVYHLRTEALWKQQMEQELLDFPAGEHDDLVDCASYSGLELLRRREPQIRRL
jgi:predicted phage terminase large subunit-like protein